MEHFGVRLIKKKYSFYLKRDEFALINTKPSLPVFENLIKRNAYTDDKHIEYTKEWCEQYRELCLQNFDLNMKYFNQLNYSDFDNAVAKFLENNSEFCKVDNLFDFNGVCGYYIMVVDKYKQAYIGRSNNIKARIQAHWTSTKAFDRTLLPMYAVNTSAFSIDFFRALDTTRIYAWKIDLPDNDLFYDVSFYDIEKELIEDFPKQFLTNRIGGGLPTPLEAIATMNKRNLT